MIRAEDVAVYAIDVRQLQDEELFYRYYAQMPRDRKRRVDQPKHQADRLRSLGAGIVWMEGMKAQGLDYQTAEVTEGIHGKPILTDGAVRFSLSHSGDYAVAAFSHCSVGIDIEQIGEAKQKIAQHFFTQSEQELLNGMGEGLDKNRLFYRLWTMKESFLKVNGEGMHLPLNSFSMQLTDKVRVQEQAVTGEYEFREYAVEEAYRITVCAKREMIGQTIRFASEIQWITISD